MEDAYADESIDSLRARADAWRACSEAQAAPRRSFNSPWDTATFAFVDYDNPTELYAAMKTTPSRQLQKTSPNAWVDCGEETYVLAGWDQSYLKLQRDGKEYVGTYYPRNPDWMVDQSATSPYWQKKQVLRSEDFEHALRGCDTFMTKMSNAAGRSPLWLRRIAQWRSRPASPRAIQMLEDKLKSKGELDEDATESPWANASLGTVSTVLTRLRHGGKSKWRRAMKRHNRAMEKAQKPRQSAGVQVGPLPRQAGA